MKKWSAKKPHNKHRGSFFARFLVETFGLEYLRQHGVIDVAGGRGHLAFQLQCLRRIPCVIVDPCEPNMTEQLARHCHQYRNRAQRRALVSAQNPGGAAEHSDSDSEDSLRSSVKELKLSTEIGGAESSADAAEHSARAAPSDSVVTDACASPVEPLSAEPRTFTIRWGGGQHESPLPRWLPACYPAPEQLDSAGLAHYKLYSAQCAAMRRLITRLPSQPLPSPSPADAVVADSAASAHADARLDGGCEDCEAPQSNERSESQGNEQGREQSREQSRQSERQSSSRDVASPAYALASAKKASPAWKSSQVKWSVTVPLEELRCAVAPADALQSQAVIIGMHPDQATEAIVDTALRRGVPFAVVPCCVFPRLFPFRRLRPASDASHRTASADDTAASQSAAAEADDSRGAAAGGDPDADAAEGVKQQQQDGIRRRAPDPWRVDTYERFCDYLQAKDPRIRRAVLPIEGRNLVLYIPP